MPKLWSLLLIFGVTIPVFSQPASSKYQPGTIMAVEPHHATASDTDSARRYDISVKVGNTMYIVLYTQPPGTISPEYRTGLQLPVLVLGSTIKFNDGLGRSRELPIIGRRAISESKS
jgi:hypothetical protein